MDIVRDILARIMAASSSLSEEMALEIERQIRRDWGGDRVYIARSPEGDLSERNRAILRDWRAGERVSLIARRYRVSRRLVYKIVRGGV